MSDTDSRAVLAYRVGQLEKTLATGLNTVGGKLDDLAHNFATKEELTTRQEAADTAHKDIRDDLTSVKNEVDELKRWRDGLITKIATSAVVGLVLMVLALYGIDKFFKP